MNKIEFIDALASKTNTTKKEAKATIEAVLEVITETLTKKEPINFIGFGSFTTKDRAARMSTIPGSTRVIEVPATTAIKFKAGKALKESVAK